MDIDIIKLAKQTDSDALGKIYMEYKDDLYFYALKMVKDSSLAEDIVQDTTVEMFKSIKNLQNDEYLKSWLIGICHNLCKKHFRTDKTSYSVSIDDENSYIEEIPDDSTSFSPESWAEKGELKDDVNAIVDTLPETQKSTLVMYYYNELSVAEIAQALGCPAGTVKSNLNYARKKVKLQCEEYERKHSCKLHSFAFAPFLSWIWKDVPSFTKFASVYKSACDTAGITASSVVTGASVATAVASSTTATAVGSAVAKTAGTAVVKKVVAGILAAAVAVTGVFIGAKHFSNNDKHSKTNKDEFSLSIEDIEHTRLAYFCGYLMVLEEDGTVSLTVKDKKFSKYIPIQITNEIQSWTDIVEISKGSSHIAGLKSDGTVVAAGYNYRGECDVQDMTDIVKICAGDYYTAGLKRDGTIVFTENPEDYEKTDSKYDTEKWKNIVNVYADNREIIGIKSDGSVLTSGNNEFDVNTWNNIVSLGDVSGHNVGIKSDGSMVVECYTEDYEHSADYAKDCPIKKLTDMVAFSSADSGKYNHIVGLKKDGTVVAIGDNNNGQCEVQGWTDVVEVLAGPDFTVGLKEGPNGYEILETKKKQIIKKEYTYKDILDLKVKLPKYEKVETIKSKKYTTDLYYIEPNEVIAGISLYFSKDLYPNNDASSDYQEITSMVSVNEFTVSDTIRTLKNIKDEYDFSVRELEYTENEDVKTKHNVYKVTGYIYTDLFAYDTCSDIVNEKENLVYYYSNVIKVGDKAVVLWVMDLTDEHAYQQECAKILNDIMMKHI